MRKLLNKPWFVAVMAVAAIAFVANAVVDMNRKPPYATNHDPYEETEYEGWSDEYDEPGDPLPTDDSGISSIREALAALVATPEKPPSDPFDDDAAELIALDESSEPEQEQMAIHLSAIWAQGSQTLVLVNDRIFIAGDSVGDLTIESTSIDGIWVTHPNGRDFVPLGRDFTWIVPTQSRDPSPTLAFNEN